MNFPFQGLQDGRWLEAVSGRWGRLRDCGEVAGEYRTVSAGLQFIDLQMILQGNGLSAGRALGEAGDADFGGRGCGRKRVDGGCLTGAGGDLTSDG